MKYLKQYKDDKEYFAHQAQKSADPKRVRVWQKRYEGRTKRFVEHFQDFKLLPKSRVLCLGARLGNEVDAWDSLGMDAVGIDLVTHGHPKIEVGNFHNLPYNNETYDVVYSNSIDHSNNVPKFISEAMRVLKHNGLLILEIMYGMDSEYEVVSITKEDLEVELAKYPTTYYGSKQITKGKLYPKGHEYQQYWRKI